MHLTSYYMDFNECCYIFKIFEAFVRFFVVFFRLGIFSDFFKILDWKRLSLDWVRFFQDF